MRWEWVPTRVRAGHKQGSFWDQCLPALSSSKADAQSWAERRAYLNPWESGARVAESKLAEQRERGGVQYLPEVLGYGEGFTASEAQWTTGVFERARPDELIQQLLIKGQLYTRPHTGGLHTSLRLIFHSLPNSEVAYPCDVGKEVEDQRGNRVKRQSWD